MLGRPEAARDLDAERGAPFAHRGRNRRSAEPDERHERNVARGVVVGMVEEAREEERRALPGREVVVEHRLQHAAGIPHVDEMDLAAAERGQEQRREHADAVTDGRAGDHRRTTAIGLHRGELMDLRVDRAVRVHDALRIGRGARRVRDERGRTRIDRGDRVDRIVGDQIGEREVARVVRGARQRSPTIATHSSVGNESRMPARLTRKS